MTSDSELDSYENLSAGERFIEAALSEHARLGRDGSDRELIHRVLLETVNRKPISSPPRTRHADRNYWIIGGISAAAAAVAAFFGLSSLDWRREIRHSEEFRFIVRIDENIRETKSATETVEMKTLAERYDEPLNIVSHSPGYGIDPGNFTGSFQLIAASDPFFAIEPTDRSWIRQESFRITSDASRISKDERIYEGRVVVEHPLFRIEAAKVIIPGVGSDSTRNQLPLLAREVKVTQKTLDCLASAAELHFDPVSGKITLSGVDRFETTEGTLRQFSATDRLILAGDHFSVEKTDVERYAAPPLLKP